MRVITLLLFIANYNAVILIEKNSNNCLDIMEIFWTQSINGLHFLFLELVDPQKCIH